MKTLLRYKFPLLILTIFIIATCKKDEEKTRDYPRINTLDVTNITDKGAVFRADIFTTGNAEIIDHGFVWSTNENNMSYEYNERISLGIFDGTGPFEAEIKTTLEAKKKYYVGSYLRTANHTVYGTVVSFVSLGSEAPTITGFEPKTAGWRDTITIKGKNFSGLVTTNKVYFGSTLASAYPQHSVSNDSTFRVIVPSQVGTIKNLIAVEIVGNRATFTKDTFKLYSPIITDFKPTTAQWGDTITIKGKDFSKRPYLNKIFFGETLATIIQGNLINDSIIHAILPSAQNSPKCILSIDLFGNKRIFTKDTFKLVLPTLNDFTPKLATWGDTITFSGKFPKYMSYNYLAIFQDANVEILNSTASSIKAIVPSILNSANSIIGININKVTILTSSNLHLKPPIIKRFNPAEVFSGSSISLVGKYLKRGSTLVKVGNLSASNVQFTNDSTIKFSTPNLVNAGNYKVSVSVLGQEVQSTQNILFKVPTITSIVPYDVTFNDTLSIYGNFFSSNPTTNIVYIDCDGCTSEKVVYASENLLKVIISADKDYYSSSSLKIRTNLGEAIKTNAFKIKEPIVYSISKTQGRSGDTISILGDYFRPKINAYMHIVDYGNIIYASKKRIDFVLGNWPASLINIDIYDWTFETISIFKNFNYISPYSIKVGMQYNSIGYNFSIDGFGYTGGGHYGYGISKYDPNQNKWISYTKVSDNEIYGPAYFSIDKKGYIISGSNTLGYYPPLFSTLNVYEFNSENNTVSLKNNLTAIPRSGSFSFSIGNKGYMGGGVDNNSNALSDFWEYDQTNDTWNQKPDFPGGTSKGSSGFVVNNKAYVLNGTKFWCYNQLTDSWEQKKDFPGIGRYLFSSFAIGKNGFITNGSPYFAYYLISPTTFFNDLWQYDTETDTWSKKTPYPGRPSFGCASFVINNKAYIGMGIRDTGYGSIYSNQFYEYDPTLEP